MVFCTDILDIVTKDFFARKSNSRVDDVIDPAGNQVQEVVSTMQCQMFEMAVLLIIYVYQMMLEQRVLYIH